MNHFTHGKAVRLAALLATLLLVLAACSGSDDPETTAEPAAEPTTEPVETEAPATEAATEMATEAPDTTTDVETETEAAGADTGTDTDAVAATGEDILTALEDAGLTSVAAAVQASGLEEEIANLPAFTLFAPGEDALLTMDQDLTAMDVTDVRDLLLAHVLDERVLTSDLSEGENTFTTVGVSELTVYVTGVDVTVGDASVTQPDIEVGESGVIHVIDAVIEPTA